MISLIEINHFAQRFKVAAETIEKDYVISWILLCLSRSEVKDFFIFYGGTAIKRMYFEKHRYSEDIDLLSARRFTLDKILNDLNCLKYASEKANLVLEINKENIIFLENRAQIYIKYQGYNEIIGAPKEIRLDFSMDMQIYGKVTEGKMIESYSDLKNLNVGINVMSLNTIFANKLGLLMELTRNEPRDLFDIWFLLKNVDKFEFNFNEVCDIFKEKYSFYPSLTILIRCLNNSLLNKNWITRPHKQVDQLPDVSKVIEDITEKLKGFFPL